MKKVNIAFVDHSTACFEKVINSDEILNNLNIQHKYFEVIDEIEGTFIYKISDIDFVSIK